MAEESRWLAEVDWLVATCDRLGTPVPTGGAVLDFGCGEDAMATAYVERGYDAYGCDIVLARPTDRLRLIGEPYRLPFDDDSFDFVSSEAVFEHVQDHRRAFAEIRRVLRPTGCSLHCFPARWAPLEPHTNVPLGTVLHGYGWLLLWAAVGVRNNFQLELPDAAAVAANNRAFLTGFTNYPRRSTILAAARAGGFAHARFVEREAHAVRGRHLGPISRLYSGLRARTLYMR